MVIVKLTVGASKVASACNAVRKSHLHCVYARHVPFALVKRLPRPRRVGMSAKADLTCEIVPAAAWDDDERRLPLDQLRQKSIERPVAAEDQRRVHVLRLQISRCGVASKIERRHRRIDPQRK